ncbi:MAG: 3-oxoacyl-ACP reductase [Planctomycetota bacterium]
MATDIDVMSEERVGLQSFSLLGKTALVTGGSRGIGKSVAVALAAAGANVAVNCYTGCKFAEDVREKIRSFGRKSEVYTNNVADEIAVEKMHEAVMNDFGQVDILVNNAGITRDKSFKKMTKEMWDSVLSVNLTGVFLVTKQFIDGMADRGWGRVINVSSIIGEHGNFGQANYAAAKAGLIGFTKTLAKEYAARGVTVNAVAPGFINTRMVQDIPDKAIEWVVTHTPVGRLGEPEEIAAGILYLASEPAGFVTGHVLDINGGHAM